MREKTYPYTPLRDVIMMASGNSGEKLTIWLIIFLLRLGVMSNENTSVAHVKPFAKKFGPNG